MADRDFFDSSVALPPGLTIAAISKAQADKEKRKMAVRDHNEPTSRLWHV